MDNAMNSNKNKLKNKKKRLFKLMANTTLVKK